MLLLRAAVGLRAVFFAHYLGRSLAGLFQRRERRLGALLVGVLALEFRPVRQMGSDHRIFAQAGIVATNVASSPGKGHTAEDTAAMVNPESLERVARLVACVVEKAR